jgi:hypothetical protein
MREIAFNVNHNVKARLTSRGREIQTRYFQLSDGPQPDSEGWRTYQMWELMLIFGQHCYMGPEPPFETNIRIMVDESECDALRAEVERCKRALERLSKKGEQYLPCPPTVSRQRCKAGTSEACAECHAEWALSEAGEAKP